MAKVMISLPDDVLASLDAEAKRRGTTRSGLVRALADDIEQERNRAISARITEIFDSGPVTSHDGRGVDHLRHDREHGH